MDFHQYDAVVDYHYHAHVLLVGRPLTVQTYREGLDISGDDATHHITISSVRGTAYSNWDA